jgi:hypothetical protein
MHWPNLRRTLLVGSSISAFRKDSLHIQLLTRPYINPSCLQQFNLDRRNNLPFGVFERCLLPIRNSISSKIAGRKLA